MNIWYLWIILGVCLVIAEIFTVTFFLLALGIAAFVVGFIAWLEYSFLTQMFAFAITVIVIFFTIRPFQLKYLHGSKDKKEIGIKKLIGKNFRVTEDIDNSRNTGRIIIGSESWLARSEDNSRVFTNSLVQIVRIEGSTAYVIKK